MEFCTHWFHLFNKQWGSLFCPPDILAPWNNDIHAIVVEICWALLYCVEYFDSLAFLPQTILITLFAMKWFFRISLRLPNWHLHFVGEWTITDVWAAGDDCFTGLGVLVVQGQDVRLGLLSLNDFLFDGRNLCTSIYSTVQATQQKSYFTYLFQFYPELSKAN
jgi:hypothetical protein